MRPSIAPAPAQPAAPLLAAAFLEGPAATVDGRVYFTDIVNNRILRCDAAGGQVEVWRSPSGRANGLLFDHLGRLLACEGNEFNAADDGGRRVTRTDLTTGRIEVLCDHWNGRRLNAPNDIACSSEGWLWFTDPCYSYRERMQLDHESVYRIDPDGRVSIAISQPDIERPNGLHLSPDERTLYVVDSRPEPGGARKLWAFALDAQRRASDRRLVYDFAPGRGGDGLAVDQQGRLYVAAGINRPRGEFESADVPAGIYVLSPQGQLLCRIPVTEDILTNVTFGGSDLQSLYITAGKTLFTARSDVPGWVVHRREGA
jgi:gluconolactonase